MKAASEGPARWRALLLSLTTLVLFTVAGLGWFQYQQVDRVTIAVVRGSNNFVWDFFKLELQLIRYQMALREAVDQPANAQWWAQVSTEYNIFASQILAIKAGGSGEIMHEHATFKQAFAALESYLDRTDPYLENVPQALDLAVLQFVLNDSHDLQTYIHRLVQDAHVLQNARSTRTLEEIRQFAFYYGITSTCLLFMTFGWGLFAVRRLVLSGQRQIEQAKKMREKKDAAEAANREKSRFLAAVSHDLRQPAHALGMFVERLSQLPADAQTKHLVACVDTSVRAMQDMLDGLFDLSRLDTESMQTRVIEFPIEELFEQLRNSFTSIAVEKGLRLRVRPSKAWIRSDPSLLHRVLLNLVSNAVRYTNRGGILVACRLAHNDTHARIEVWDSGIGIAVQHQEEIFDEFFQVGNEERDRSKGLGVGLSIVDRACRLLNHPLSMRSELGRGSRFSLTVPLTHIRSNGSTQVATALPTMPDLEGLHILVVEDDALGKESLVSLLESWGCKVTVADGAIAACELYRHDQCPDFIISDYRLRDGLNGVDAVGMVRNTSGREIAACLISGDTEAIVRQQAQAAGLVLLHKPVRPAKLRSLLRNRVQGNVAQ